MQHTYDVIGMHCQSCVGKVTDALENVEGVTAANVTLDPPRARVDMKSHVATEILNRAAKGAGGYQIVAGNSAPHSVTAAAPKESLYPLFLIIGYIVGTIAIVGLATGERSPHVLMRYFMGGFFLVFSF